MIFTETTLQGSYTIELEPFSDEGDGLQDIIAKMNLNK